MARKVKSVHEVLESREFKHLVARRWRVSSILSILLFAIYYGYILLIGYNKKLLMREIGNSTTLGIPLGVSVIVLSWVLTVIYVFWANKSYDPEVQRLKDHLKE
ncbi:MAG: DUF485 domain-containing protein [Lentisphaerae bacterium]|nr:DUF485 domain-containing protein [Lentisphaerota bacterium]